MRIIKCDYCKKVFESGVVFSVNIEINDFKRYDKIIKDTTHVSSSLQMDLCTTCIKSVSMVELSERLLKEQKILDTNKPFPTPPVDKALFTKSSIGQNGITWKTNK